MNFRVVTDYINLFQLTAVVVGTRCWIWSCWKSRIVLIRTWLHYRPDPSLYQVRLARIAQKAGLGFVGLICLEFTREVPSQWNISLHHLSKSCGPRLPHISFINTDLPSTHLYASLSDPPLRVKAHGGRAGRCQNHERYAKTDNPAIASYISTPLRDYRFLFGKNI
jgi:hypothetical protein